MMYDFERQTCMRVTYCAKSALLLLEVSHAQCSAEPCGSRPRTRIRVGLGRTRLSSDAPPEAVPRALTPWLALSGTLLLRHRQLGSSFAAACDEVALARLAHARAFVPARELFSSTAACLPCSAPLCPYAQ